MTLLEDQITAKAHTDDGRVHVTFDATPYFEQATDAELRDLIDCDFANDYPADEVVIALAAQSAALTFMVAYIEWFHVGFECCIASNQARAWLRKYRPHLLAEADGGSV